MYHEQYCLPCKVRLRNFKDMRKNVNGKGKLRCITLCKVLVPDVESPFLRLTNIEVTNFHTKVFRVTRPIKGSTEQPFAKIPQDKVKFKMNINAFTRSYGSDVVTPLASGHVRENRMVGQEILPNKSSRQRCVPKLNGSSSLNQRQPKGVTKSLGVRGG